MTPEQQKAVAIANARMRMQQTAPQAVAPTPSVSRTKAFGSGAADMTSFGLDDELRGFGRAVGTKIRGDERPMSDLVNMAISEMRGDQNVAKTERPGAYLSGQIAGAIAPAFLSQGQALARWGSTGGLGARMAKGAAVGGGSSALYGFGSGEDGLQNRLEKSAKYGATGAVIGAAIPLAGAGLNKLNKSLGKTVVPTSEDVRSAASGLFKEADAAGGVLKADVADDFLDKVLEIRPQTEAGRVFKGKTPVTSVLDEIPSLKGKPLTLQGAKEVDEALGDLAYSTMDKFGKLSSDGKKFLDMQSALRKTIENADESMVEGGKEGFFVLKEARKQWATSLKMRDIERIIENSKNYEQPATHIRTGFRRLADTAKKNGYTTEEIKAIKQAAKTGLTTDLFRLMGSGLVPIGSAITGTATTGPVGGAVAGAGGYALQQGSKAVGVARQTARANKALETVAERSGMVTKAPLISQSVPNVIQPTQSSALIEFSKKFK